MEWEVVTVIVVLVGLVGALLKPAIKWSNNLTDNTAAIRGLTEAIKKNETQNEKAHEDIWEHEGDQDTRLTKHDDRINDHETRITILEKNR